MTPRRTLSFGRRGVTLVWLTLLGAAAALAQPLGGPLTGLAAAANSAAPYMDPSAVGSIGLCNQAGQQITSGSVTARPFAWRAVSTQPAQLPYNKAGRTAILVAYQPLQGLPAGDWSGTQMTASSRYTNPGNPMVAATDGDLSLDDVIEQYPPKWDGFLQLRIYLGAPQESAFTQQYPALNIEVTGETWTAVGGSPVNCASGTAQSIESVLLPSTTTAPTTSSPTTSTTTSLASTGSKGASEGTDPHSSGTKAGSAGRALASDKTTTDEASSSTGLPLFLVVGLAVLVLLAALAYLILRRRRLASHHPGAGSDLHSPSKTSMKGDSP